MNNINFYKQSNTFSNDILLTSPIKKSNTINKYPLWQSNLNNYLQHTKSPIKSQYTVEDILDKSGHRCLLNENTDKVDNLKTCSELSNKFSTDTILIACKIKDNDMNCKSISYYNNCSNNLNPNQNNYFCDYQIKKDLFDKCLELNTQLTDIFNKCSKSYDI